MPKKLSIQESEKKNKNKNDTNEPVIKKQKLYRLQENDFEVDPLAAFCDHSQRQVIDVHCTSKKVEDRLVEHQQQSFLFEQRLKDALLSEIKST